MPVGVPPGGLERFQPEGSPGTQAKPREHARGNRETPAVVAAADFMRDREAQYLELALKLRGSLYGERCKAMANCFAIARQEEEEYLLSTRLSKSRSGNA